jgi:CRISPR/Cas system-associated exonuclease Cas4 (RecB family)
MRSGPNISKSRFLQGLQCSKLIWSAYNAKQLFPEVDEALQAVFDQGHEVGSLAKKMFPNGVEIDVADPTDFQGAILLTQKHLMSRRPIFEATASASGGFARADILNPVGKEEWDIIEVKSSTGLKDVHILDLAFQAWVFKQAGIRIRRCLLCHINNRFVRHGEIDPSEFFTLRDVTAKVAELDGDIERQIGSMREIIRSEKCPDVQIGKQCDSPYACPLHDQCWSFLPPRNVMELSGDNKGRRWDLLQKRNILRICDIPEDYPLSAKQEIQRATAVTGKPHVKQKAIQTFLKNLEYPLHFLDFETFSTAIPIFDGTRPYEQIPFQFSLHVVHKAGTMPEHRKYLADGRNDPRPEFMRQLKSAIEPAGSILVFNASFEKGRMRECANLLPEYKPWVAAVNHRIVDLLNPFKAFNFYHPDQCGSASMKSVLPALTGKDYASLEIQEGGAASREFIRATFGDVAKSERERVRQALDLYCGQDTEGMIWILDALRRV